MSDSLVDRAQVARDHGAADALVALVEQHFDAGIDTALAHERAGPIGAGVVDDEDALDLRSDSRQHVQHMRSNPVCRHDNCDTRRLQNRRRRGMVGPGNDRCFFQRQRRAARHMNGVQP